MCFVFKFIAIFNKTANRISSKGKLVSSEYEKPNAHTRTHHQNHNVVEIKLINRKNKIQNEVS